MPAEPTLTDVVQQIVDLHKCQEKNALEARKGLKKAADAQLALADEVAKVSAKVDDRHAELDRKIGKGWKDFNNSAWKLVGAIGGVILAGVVAVVCNNISFNSNVATKSDVSVHTAQRYTSAQAAADRAAQDARDRQILDQLAQLKAASR